MDDDIIFEEEDLVYEEDILKNPYSVKSWLRYIEFKKHSPKIHTVYLIYERALQQLPGSYKLWYGYLRLRRIHTRRKCPGDADYEETNNAHERSLVFMHKMPRIWTDYATFLIHQGFITRTRRTLDRALRALPITQHDRIWKIYLKYIEDNAEGAFETALRVYRRYVKFAPDDMERYISFLVKHGSLDEAAICLAQIINDEEFVSREGKSKHQLWHELCQLTCKNPLKINSIQVDPIIRQGIRRYTDQVGMLWNSLAEYYIRGGNLERARDIYEEAIETVLAVRDFTQVFDAYAEFEESIVKNKMERLEEVENAGEKEEFELELGLARLEDLMERRPILLNSVLLRQNPHNVAEWHKRVQLHESKGPREQIATYMEAVTTVDPAKASGGRPCSLWIELAKLYEKHKQLDDARVVFEKATAASYVHVEDLASVWAEWAEMEVRHEHYKEALEVLGRATTLPAHKVDYYDKSEPVQNRVYKSLKLWSLYADLEESFGTFQTTKSVYDRIIDLRIATPLVIINYGLFLEENNYFEDAFKAYEKGISLFKWPNVYDIWTTYLTKFINRYGGTKLERARDLFEQCLEACPEQFAKNICILYAKLEEEHGLARRAMNIYERATERVKQEEKFEMFNIYIQRIAELFGVTHSRQAYERAIEVLPEEHAREMCLRFADMERKLGEVDRARAVYSYCAQMCDPRTCGDFWQTWKEFEISHGNEDTLREMLRIRRSVQATYNTQVNFMAAQMGSAAQGSTESEPANDMQRVEEAVATANAQPIKRGAQNVPGGIQFVSAGVTGGDTATLNKEKVANPEGIDIDDDDESDDDDEETLSTEQKEDEDVDVPIEKQTIPKEVFQGLKDDSESDENGD